MEASEPKQNKDLSPQLPFPGGLPQTAQARPTRRAKGLDEKLSAIPMPKAVEALGSGQRSSHGFPTKRLAARVGATIKNLFVDLAHELRTKLIKAIAAAIVAGLGAYAIFNLAGEDSTTTQPNQSGQPPSDINPWAKDITVEPTGKKGYRLETD